LSSEFLLIATADDIIERLSLLIAKTVDIILRLAAASK
jgi:hypothetical protein